MRTLWIRESISLATEALRSLGTCMNQCARKRQAVLQPQQRDRQGLCSSLSDVPTLSTRGRWTPAGVSHRERPPGSRTFTTDSVTIQRGPEIPPTPVGRCVCGGPCQAWGGWAPPRRQSMERLGSQGDTPPQSARVKRPRPGDPGNALVWGLFHQKTPI